MIVYDPFWRTLKARGLNTYKLIHIYGISSNTIHRMRHNNGISTGLINELCALLDCKVEDILLYVPDKDTK
nr:helix-turn-helix domain-containing protein [Maliibacterium massiliense]